MIREKLENYIRTHSFVKVIDSMMQIEFYISTHKIHLREIVSDFKYYDLIIDHKSFETMYAIEYIEEIGDDIYLKDKNGRLVEIQGISFNG